MAFWVRESKGHPVSLPHRRLVVAFAVEIGWVSFGVVWLVAGRGGRGRVGMVQASPRLLAMNVAVWARVTGCVGQ